MWHSVCRCGEHAEARAAAIHGSARWAVRSEILSAGLAGVDGIVLGRFERNYLRHDGPEHVLCFALMRSGKGVGLVIPTLLSWPGNCIVHDIKDENWTITSEATTVRRPSKDRFETVLSLFVGTLKSSSAVSGCRKSRPAALAPANLSAPAATVSSHPFR